MNKKYVCALLAVCLLLACACARAHSSETALGDDLGSVRLCREGLASTMAFVASRPDLFPERRLGEKRMLSTGQKALLRSTWQSFLDYCLCLEELNQKHKNFYGLKSKQARRDSFVVLYAAFLAQYRYALEFLARAENDPSLDVVFNESDPVLGLPEKTYAAFKYRFLNLAAATRFAALNAVYGQYSPDFSVTVPSFAAVDRDAVWATGKGTGGKLTLRNAVHILKGAGSEAWLPLQQRVSEFMGDTKVWRRDRALISRDQIHAMLPRLEPGDIIFERREWYLSNIGLPGFWTHVALFVGTPAERKTFFGSDAQVCAWLGGAGMNGCDFEGFLRNAHPRAYERSLAAQEEGFLPRIIEATGEGVSLTSFEHTAHCDSIAVLRPRLSKKEKARAIERAFGYVGRPYDFNFDFLTDAALVCSELVYKSYEPAPGCTGLELPLVEMLGRMLTPPNEIVRQFDLDCGTARQQTDLVLFYDGAEHEKRARESTLAEFRRSWSRPKWHVLVRRPGPVDLFASGAGIWEIPAPAGRSRWIVIHNPAEARRTGVFHVEVLGKEAGRPDREFKRLCSHMAITREALEQSVIRPRETGAVYPESFNDAYAAWQRQHDDGGAFVCSSTVAECLDEGSVQ